MDSFPIMQRITCDIFAEGVEVVGRSAIGILRSIYALVGVPCTTNKTPTIVDFLEELRMRFELHTIPSINA